MAHELQQKFTKNAEEFDALMVEMLAENETLKKTTGLKEYQIAEIVNAVTECLNMKIKNMPNYTREIVRDAVVSTLENRGLRSDA